jgi:hypothetical protein
MLNRDKSNCQYGPVHLDLTGVSAIGIYLPVKDNDKQIVIVMLLIIILGIWALVRILQTIQWLVECLVILIICIMRFLLPYLIVLLG